MINIVVNFKQIVQFAKQHSIPTTKRRGILREFLQCKILEYIYQQKESQKIFLVGGTSLRLLRNLPRFSEDLDFDVVNISRKGIKKIVFNVAAKLQRENFSLDLFYKSSKQKDYYEIRFKNILFYTHISTDKNEKLTIKLDFENYWQNQTQEVKLLNNYGIITQVPTIIIDQLLVQKLFAYINRKQTQPRDIFDIIWLYSQGAKIDYDFAKANDIPTNLIQKANQKYIREKHKLALYKKKLQPFLFIESDIYKLGLLPQVLKELKNDES